MNTPHNTPHHTSHKTMLQSLQMQLQERERIRMQWPGFRQAAVLVPLLRSEQGLQLLFTVRSAQLSHHAGQISFPGGRLDPGESIEDAALRETYEEIGVLPEQVQLLGRLHDLPSPARYIVTPVVALLEPSISLNPSPHEVAEIFTVPLDDLLTIEPYSEERILEEQRRRIYFYSWQQRMIWGLTGNVVQNLLELITAAGYAHQQDSLEPLARAEPEATLEPRVSEEIES